MSIVLVNFHGICSRLLVSLSCLLFGVSRCGGSTCLLSFRSCAVDSPVEVIVGTLFLYKLLGISCFTGLAVMCLFLPLNHYGVKVLVAAQEELMRSRDERVALMNEVRLSIFLEHDAI